MYLHSFERNHKNHLQILEAVFKIRSLEMNTSNDRL
jgi:hypothetical protein